jgi:biopolymer transport protein ExbD
MSELTLRQRRQQRQARHKKGMALNIVSLIDIFTVLVFFLLLNSTELELLPEAQGVHLPESSAVAAARQTVVVMVNREQIMVQGMPVANVEQVLSSADPTIPALKDALSKQILPPPDAQATDAVAQPDAAPPPREVTIMGDREIPYRLLKKVLATCADSAFGKLSLAVLQKAGDAPQPVAGYAQ